jgi:hypothetical protein
MHKKKFESRDDISQSLAGIKIENSVVKRSNTLKLKDYKGVD